jgi:hypothetical protein
LGVGSLIRIPLEDFHVAFLFFFWRVGLVAAFRLPAHVLEALTWALAERSLADSPLGDWAKTGMVGIGMSTSYPGIGEIKLSKACIQIYEY